jgi:hypothetical protein
MQVPRRNIFQGALKWYLSIHAVFVLAGCGGDPGCYSATVCTWEWWNENAAEFPLTWDDLVPDALALRQPAQLLWARNGGRVFNGKPSRIPGVPQNAVASVKGYTWGKDLFRLLEADSAWGAGPLVLEYKTAAEAGRAMDLIARKFLMIGASWMASLVCTEPTTFGAEVEKECDPLTTRTVLLEKGGYDVMFASYVATWETALTVLPADGQCTYGHNEKGFVLETMLGISEDYPFGSTEGKEYCRPDCPEDNPCCIKKYECGCMSAESHQAIWDHVDRKRRFWNGGFWATLWLLLICCICSEALRRIYRMLNPTDDDQDAGVQPMKIEEIPKRTLYRHIYPCCCCCATFIFTYMLWEGAALWFLWQAPEVDLMSYWSGCKGPNEVRRPNWKFGCAPGVDCGE